MTDDEQFLKENIEVLEGISHMDGMHDCKDHLIKTSKEKEIREHAMQQF